jgi:sugar phosphate permease
VNPEMTMSAIPLTEGIDARDALYRKITWRLLPFLTLCYMLAYLDRINIGFAKLQMQNQLSFSDAAYGVAAGIFFIGYVLFEIPSNLLLPRIGARKTLSRIMVLRGSLPRRCCSSGTSTRSTRCAFCSVFSKQASHREWCST